MTIDQATKAARFRALHERPEPLLMPNPWDAGTARMLAALGFEALATTSLGVANTIGAVRASRQAVLDNCRDIDEATSLPVNADLENGYAHDPERAARMVEAAAEHGVVGASIEDYTGEDRTPIYDFELAVDRIRAAARTAHALPVPILLTARAENLIRGVNDLGDTIKRLQAYSAAGADVLYAPGLRTLDDMRAVVDAVDKPVNVVMGFGDPSITLDQLAGIGVRRVSIGGALSRVALAAFLDAARHMRAGRFEFVATMPPLSELYDAFG